MLRVSLLVELLRSRPKLVFWSATIAQALLWIAAPALVYGAPPGNLPLLLAVGHEWRLGSSLGPPLASWVAELTFDLTGRSRVGIYMLSQVCIVVTYWSVFALARTIVGSQHAAMAVLLMTGVVAFSADAVEFGPHVLAMPLTALAMLHYWRAVGMGRRRWWIALGFDLGLLGLTSYPGLILVGLIGLFTVSQPRARAAFATVAPYIGAAIFLVLLVPHFVWLHRAGQPLVPSRATLGAALLAQGRLDDWLGVVGSVAALQAGLFALLAIASAGVDSPASAPAFERTPIDPLGRRFVYFFALMPGLSSTVLSMLMGQSTPAGGVGPLVVLSGLAVVVCAGDVIRLHRQLVLTRAWAALLVVPPLAAIAAVALTPWTIGIGFEVDRPTIAIGRFFTETFRRRTAHPLAIVAGDASVAGLIAMGSADRPRLFLVDRPELNTISEDAIRREGAVVVWPVQDNAQTEPAEIKAHFPDLAVEVPQSFHRPIHGRLPPYRIGWAMIRPAPEPAPAPP